MQSITIENSLYVGSQNARFFVNDAVRLQLSDGTSISGIISNLNNFIVVVEDENGTETSIYIGDIVGCASEASQKKKRRIHQKIFRERIWV